MHAEASPIAASPRQAIHRLRLRGLTPSAAYLVSLVYAGLLLIIPWAAIRGEPFWDLTVYLDGFESGAYDYLDLLEGPAYLFSEPLWRYIISGLASLLGDVAITFHTVSFAASTVYAYAILRTDRSAVVYLAGPLLIDLVLSQVRSAVAGALFFMASLAGSVLLWIVLLVIATLIHSAAFLLFALFALAGGLQYLSARRPLLGRSSVVLASLLIPLAFAAVYSGVLGLVGDRRAEYEAAWPGGVFVLSLSLYYVALLLNLKTVVKRQVAIFSLLMTGLFIVLAAFDINALRFIALTYPALIATAFSLSFIYRVMVLSLLFMMCMYHLVFWI